jgi:uncharacterized membrane protein
MSSQRPDPAEQVAENIETILAFYKREEEKISSPQRALERVGGILGRPAFIAVTLLFVASWIGVQLLGWFDFDPPPFFWLQGVLSLSALLTAAVILITQNRQSNIEAMHAHLDLQVNMLTEQKVSKLIKLIEELRRDLPMVRDRHDATAEALQEPADTHEMLEVLHEKRSEKKPTDS